jgi:hypothetical protein
MGKPKSVLNLECKTFRRELTAADIDPTTGIFERMDNARKIAPGTVAKLLAKMLSGETIEQPLVVNKRSERWRLIDGNHRYLAIAKYLAMEPTHRVETTITEYEGLSDDEEKAIYTEWNLGRKQSTNDVVQQYWDEIPIVNDFEKLNSQGRLPVSVTPYPCPTSINLYRLAGAYLSAIRPTFPGGYTGSAFEFVDEVQKLGLRDATLMAEFMRDLITALGAWKNNPFGKTTPFNALMRIWLDNRERFTPDKLQRIWKTKLLGDYEVKTLMESSGIGATKHAYGRYLDILNAQRSRDLFQPWPPTADAQQ